MAVLVTGGAGYIGSHTCVELLDAGYDVVVADNLSNSSEISLQRVQKITGKPLTFYNADVRNGSKLDEIFTRHDISQVIHFAGFKAVGESVAKPLMYYRNNLDSTISLCEAMLRHNVMELVFSSSATVYSPGNTMPLSESSSTGNCTNPYGWTKFMCEQIITDVVRAHEGFSAALLRYFNPVGAHPSGLIGEDPSGIPNNLMPFISQTAVGRRKELSVFGSDYDTPDGTGVRDYLHVVDLAKGHVSAIRYLDDQSGVHIFNLGTGRGSSVLEMVHTFERVNGVRVPYRIAERRPGDLATVYADPSKSNRDLHWKTEKNLDDMCRDSWHWQSSNPNGYES
ncbi:MAG: UDP-glucose 4-epimerase GalE [Erysipelotrichales bacterium]|nr:UDP-glucose 4-epimerase GalE [Erysipelotrichales bacterium]